MSTPKVSIITRTRNRDLFLRRAAQSVLGQRKAPAWEWIVVNDGGDPQVAEAVLDPFRKELAGRLQLLHIDKSKGMEHASNQGIERATGEFLVIHDDDDSWDPAFLLKMTAELDAPANRDAGGVVCHSIRIVETVGDNSLKEQLRHPFNDDLTDLSFWDVLQQNRFPPISFLFRRSLCDTVGPFNENLPVLGDWEFNLRVLARHRLVVLPEALAFYHHRLSPADPAHANSITGGDARHREIEKRLRREWGESNPFGIPAELFTHAARIAGDLHRLKVGLHNLEKRAAGLPRPAPPQF